MPLHALLSPSSASRWLSCTPSARLEAKVDEQTSSYADEGTLAHSVAELILLYRLKRIDKTVFKKRLKDYQTSVYFNNELFDYCEEFAVFVLEAYNEILNKDSKAEIFLESKVYLLKYSPDCWGTIDIRIVSRYYLHIIDLKFGKGVSVSAISNKQLFLYALGALELATPTIKTVKMTIYQPRISNISETIVAATWLKDWGLRELVPKAKAAYNGEGERVAGNHCQFCKVKYDCRAYLKYQMQTVESLGAYPDTLTPKEISKIILKANEFEAWLTTVKNWAANEAIKNGVKFPGLKIVKSKSPRRYKDEAKVIEILRDEFYSDSEIFNTSLKGLTDITKLLGKKSFAELIEPLLFKPPGTPILVSESDKRAEYDPSTKAFEDFAEFEEGDDF